MKDLKFKISSENKKYEIEVFNYLYLFKDYFEIVDINDTRLKKQKFHSSFSDKKYALLVKNPVENPMSINCQYSTVSYEDMFKDMSHHISVGAYFSNDALDIRGKYLPIVNNNGILLKYIYNDSIFLGENSFLNKKNTFIEMYDYFNKNDLKPKIILYPNEYLSLSNYVKETVNLNFGDVYINVSYIPARPRLAYFFTFSNKNDFIKNNKNLFKNFTYEMWINSNKQMILMKMLINKIKNDKNIRDIFVKNKTEKFKDIKRKIYNNF